MDVANFFRHLCELVLHHQMRVSNYFVNSFYSVVPTVDKFLHNKPIKITINVPVVFMARYIMVLRGATSLWGALEGVGLENRDFFEPWNGTSKASAIWAQKSRNHYV